MSEQTGELYSYHYKRQRRRGHVDEVECERFLWKIKTSRRLHQRSSSPDCFHKMSLSWACLSDGGGRLYYFVLVIQCEKEAVCQGKTDTGTAIQPNLEEFQ